MNPIVIAIIIVAGIGLVVGLILAVASIVFAVPKNEMAEAVLEVLPGANCGACGFSGCSGYAAALADGSAESGLCAPGGTQVVKAVAKVLGKDAGLVEKKTAVVHCVGSCDNTDTKMEYDGIKTCKAASVLTGGTGKCGFGCIGFGDCVNACEYDAIRVCNGVAVVNPESCKACKKCVAVCPKNIISIIPVKKAAVVRCSNHDKGGITKKACTAGCIGCMRCTKVCPTGAIKVENFLASIDSSLCTGCGSCMAECKQGCITM
ncbi:MAG TPA: RnfABCDGE type electron transport complex subunit B [Clostridiales bacterium]|nr:RnfABCDGE type electron transport complex subunit B [Clostridiales bacterium]